MPDELPIQVQNAIAGKPLIPTHRDLQELIAMEKEKEKAAAPEKPEEKPKKGHTKEEAAKTTEMLAKRLGFDRPLPEIKKEEKKDEKPETGKASAGETSKVGEQHDKSDVPTAKDKLGSGVGEGDKPAQEDPPKKGKVSKKKEIDPVEIATHAATRAAQEVLQSTSPRLDDKSQRLEKVPGVSDENLSDEERDELAIFKEMADHNPAFKSLPQQYISYLKKAESYQRDWEKSNPGEVFDPEDDIHDKFFDSAQPKYSERDFRKAEARMAAREMIGKEREEVSKETSALKAQLAVRELEPHIRNVQIGATAEIIKTINEDWLKTIEKDGFQKFSESNPAESELIQQVANNIGPFIAAAIAIDDPKGRIPIDHNDPSHQQWAAYLTAKENELRTKAVKDRQTDDGRLIISRAEYAQLPATRRGAYAYLDTDALINMRVMEEAEKIQENYERKSKQFEAWAKSQGWIKSSDKSTTQSAKNGENKKDEKPEEKREEIKSPEASSAARVDTSGETQGMKANNFLENSARILFGR